MDVLSLKQDYEVNLKTTSTIDQLKNNLLRFFSQSSSYSGEFINERKFKAFDNFIVMAWEMPYIRRKSASIEGEIITEKTGSSLQLSINTNPILKIFAAIASLIGIVLIGISFFDLSNKLPLLLYGSFLVLLGIIYFTANAFFKYRMVKQLVKALNLKE